MKRSPDFANIMTECPLEHQACFPSLGKESVREYASRHTQLSVRGKQVFDRLLVLLPTYLKSQTTSRVSPFPPALLFSICDALQHAPGDGSAEQSDTSILPSVLSKLRDWRLLDPDYRYTSGGLYKLALDLAGITNEASASTSSDVKRTSHARLRMKWVGSSDSPSESRDREPSSSAPPSPSPSSRSSVLDSTQECAHALPGLNERRSDAGYESCQVGRLGTPDSEDASAVVSRRLHSVSGFRSGCSACRHPRISGPSTPPSPQMASFAPRMPFSDVNQFDTNINTSVPSPRHPKHSVPTKKTRREKHTPLHSISRSAHVDENEPPLPTSMGVQQGIGISFPRQRTHYPRISNILSSRDPFSPAVTFIERRIEPSHLPNRTREGDKHTFSHRTASVDFRLPIANHSPNRASPIDLHPHAPTRAQSFPHTPVNSHGLGSVASRAQKLSSNAVGSGSSKRLPSWSQSHLRRPPMTTTTTTTTSVKLTGSLSPSPAKANFENPHPFTRLRPSSTSIPPRVASDVTHRDRRTVSSQTHKHTQSAGSLPLSPLSHARKLWL